MKQVSLHILENTALAQGIYRLRLGGDVSAVTDPGQFVNIKLDGFFLRRPISVCDWQDGELTLIYKVLGRGSSRWPSGWCIRSTRRYTSPSWAWAASLARRTWWS